MIDFSLHEEQTLIVETTRSFARDHLSPALRSVEEASALSPELLRAWVEIGLGGISLPESVGGAGLGTMGAALVLEELAAHDVAIAWALPGFEPAACVLRTLQEPTHSARWLAPSLEQPGFWGALALRGGAHAPLTCHKDGENWRISGRLAAVERAPGSSYLLVPVSLEERGDVLVALPTDTPGMSQGQALWKLGLAATPVCDVVLDNVLVSPGAIVLEGAALEPTLRRAWVELAVQQAALHLGLAKASHLYALGYTQERIAFGKPVAHFQAPAFMLADAAILLDAARWTLWKAAVALDKGELAALEVAEALLQAQEASQRICDDGVQLLGGAGYVQDHPVEKWMRDQKALSVVGVTPEAAEDLLVKCLTKQDWNGGDLVALHHDQHGLV